ncbi:MAG: hypothetical protein ABI273_12100 [Lacunisphaera sp.]
MPVHGRVIKILRSWRTLIVAVVFLAGIYFLARSFSIATVHAYASRLNGPLAFLLLTVLPLLGFPVSVLHVTAGIRFGVARGLALVALSILIQLLASYALVHWRESYFKRRFQKIRAEIPSGAHRAVTIFTLLVPGVPYFAKNYVLPVIGVPLRTYLAWGFPIHVAQSVIAVVLGDQSDHLTSLRVAVMVGYYAATLAASWWAFRRVRAQVVSQPKAAGDRK